MKLKLLRGFALFFALLYLPFPAYAFSFSNLYVFGDSLSDSACGIHGWLNHGPLYQRKELR
jgi:phospholipase/lecithinase/hemolysin